jgi:hypothetical protein
METQSVMRFWLQCHSQARRDFVSRDDCGQKSPAVSVRKSFAQRDGRREHHYARMNGTCLMGIVQFYAVSHGALASAAYSGEAFVAVPLRYTVGRRERVGIR